MTLHLARFLSPPALVVLALACALVSATAAMPAPPPSNLEGPAS
jgi:hypothetical protein